MGGPKLAGPSSRKRTMLLLVEKVGQSAASTTAPLMWGDIRLCSMYANLPSQVVFSTRHFPLLALLATAGHLGLPTGGFERTRIHKCNPPRLRAFQRYKKRQ